MSASHDWINFDAMTQVLNSGVTGKGHSRSDTCNGAYKGSLNVGAETRGDDDILKNLLKDDSRWISCHDTECQSATGSS